MKVLSKVNMLAERNSWSVARAQGFVDGEIARRRGGAPSIYARVGIDDYSQGFRAGYYERAISRFKAVVTSPSSQLKESAAAGGVD